MEAILDHYHAKLAEQDMSEAEVIGERNTNRSLTTTLNPTDTSMYASS